MNIKGGKVLSHALIGVLLTMQPTNAQALQKWNCVVEDFKGFGDQDTDFIVKNKRKQFMLTVSKAEVLAKMFSKEFEGSETRYHIVGGGVFYQHAISNDLVSFDTVSLPLNPERAIEKEGFFNATISTHGNFYVNSWLLRCLE